MPYWLEFAYYLTGGPLLALLAGVGLWQLRLAKNGLDASIKANELAQRDFEQRIESDRIRLTVDLCLTYSREVLPLINAADSKLRRSLPVARPGSDPWLLESYDLRMNSGVSSKQHIASITQALNAMEAVAVPFVSNAADADIARESFGLGFCSTAQRYSYVVAVLRSEYGDSVYPALRGLVKIWSGESAVVRPTNASA